MRRGTAQRHTQRKVKYALYCKNGEVAIVDLAGRFTLDSGVGVIRGAVNTLLKDGEQNILLNLEDVVYLDSAAGIGEIVASYTRTRRQGGSLKLLRPGHGVENVLRIVGLNRVFETFTNEEEAVRSFAPQASAAYCSM